MNPIHYATFVILNTAEYSSIINVLDAAAFDVLADAG